MSLMHIVWVCGSVAAHVLTAGRHWQTIAPEVRPRPVCSPPRRCRQLIHL